MTRTGKLRLRLARRTRLTTRLFAASVSGAFVFLYAASALNANAMAQENPYSVKAAFLRNFAHYVDWPDSAFNGVADHWRICVIGPDPFGEILDNTLQDRNENGRSFTVVRVSNAKEARNCHIAYVTYQDDTLRRAILAETRGMPILTAGDADTFLDEGGIIRFNVRDRIGMSVNLDQARSVSLKIQTKMLEVSNDVLVNGAFIRVR
ncbi:MULTISPECIES: YfiR family protein [Methylomonas]|uniref:YfiR family protein n=1 Tax=Methylomonas TaxID=416 RepID=UPI0012326CE5|nr:YfiR family protein [Methylomonas rhizoryzae]